METIRLLMSTDARRDEVRTVDEDWEFSSASAGPHNARIQEARYSLTYPTGSIRPAAKFRYPPC